MVKLIFEKELMVVQAEYEVNPFALLLFLFCGTRRDCFRDLYGKAPALYYFINENGYYNGHATVMRS